MLLLFTGGSGSGIDPHPLAYLFDAADGFIYDGAYASGGIDFGVDEETECEASGDPCGFVRDVSGTGWNLEQAVSANRLTFRVDAGGIKSFITGPTTNGGSAKWAEVTGATALTAEYTDIAIVKLLKLNDPDGDVFWDVSNFTGTGGTFDASYHCGYGSPSAGHPNYGAYQYLRSAGAPDVFIGSVSNTFPTINGTGFYFLANSPSAGVSSKDAQQTPGTLDFGGAPLNIVQTQSAYPRVRIGYDVDYKIINVEYAFRMRIHRLLTTEEITAVLAYLNGASGLSAWTGGAA